MKPKMILQGYLGQNLELNCSTNDENATVSLLYRHHPLAPFTKRQLRTNKLLIKGQVFTLLNLDEKDQGMYACEAKTKEDDSIRWPPGRGYLLVSQGKNNLKYELTTLVVI